MNLTNQWELKGIALRAGFYAGFCAILFLFIFSGIHARADDPADTAAIAKWAESLRASHQSRITSWNAYSPPVH